MSTYIFKLIVKLCYFLIIYRRISTSWYHSYPLQCDSGIRVNTDARSPPPPISLGAISKRKKRRGRFFYKKPPKAPELLFSMGLCLYPLTSDRTLFNRPCCTLFFRTGTRGTNISAPACLIEAGSSVSASSAPLPDGLLIASDCFLGDSCDTVIIRLIWHCSRTPLLIGMIVRSSL